MKLLVLFFALFVCLVGFANATICAYNMKTKQFVNFVNDAALQKAQKERRKYTRIHKCDFNIEQ